MEYPSISRRTDRFEVIYNGGQTIMRVLGNPGYECFRNHQAQEDLLESICGQWLSDEEFDSACGDFLSRRKVSRYRGPCQILSNNHLFQFSN